MPFLSPNQQHEGRNTVKYNTEIQTDRQTDRAMLIMLNNNSAVTDNDDNNSNNNI